MLLQQNVEGRGRVPSFVIRPLLLVGALPFLVALVPQSSGGALAKHLGEMQAAPQLQVTLRVVSPDGGSETHTLSMQKPNRLRWDSPKQLVVLDGEWQVTYDKAKKTFSRIAVKEATGPFRDDRIWVYGAFFDPAFADQIKGERRGALVADQMQVNLQRTAGPLTVMIDQTTGSVKSVSYPAGSPGKSVIVSTLERRTDGIPASLFVWKAPVGATEAVVSEIPSLGWKDVGPFFARACAPCHTDQRQGRLSLRSYANLMGNDVVMAGNGKGSKLVRAMRTGWMPPQGSVTTEEIDRVEQWIEQGAKE